MSNQLLKLIFTQAWQIAVLAIFVAVVTRHVDFGADQVRDSANLGPLVGTVQPVAGGVDVERGFFFSRLDR